MAIDTAARRQNALFEPVLLPDGTLGSIVDRYAMLEQFYPVPPTGVAPFGGAPSPRPRSTILEAPRPRQGRDE